MSIEQKDLCEKHYHEFDGLRECPLCVIEERDRLKALVKERDRLQGIIQAALRAAPVGYLPTHDAEHLPQIVADLAETAGRCGAAEDERDYLSRLLRELERKRHELSLALTVAEQERDRLRDLIPQAWRAGMEHMDDVGPGLDEWMEGKGIA
jgi:hypothetical protein